MSPMLRVGVLSCAMPRPCLRAGRLQDFIIRLHDGIASSFLPRKQDVTEDYWEWLKWRLGQVGPCIVQLQLGLEGVQAGALNTLKQGLSTHRRSFKAVNTNMGLGLCSRVAAANASSSRPAAANRSSSSVTLPS